MNKHTILILSILNLFVLIRSEAQLDVLKSFYSNQISNKHENCKIQILQDSSVEQIILIRHGNPKVDKKGWFSSKDAQEYSRLYDLVEVERIIQSPICFDSNLIDTLYSSNLVRAKNTAAQIKNDVVFLKSNAIFREFERDIFSFPILKMPLNFWLATSRLFWYAGIHSKSTESRKSAMIRVKKSADYLINRTEENGIVVLVAHGMFNGKLKKVLKKKGWENVLDTGKGYLSVKILAKRKKGP